MMTHALKLLKYIFRFQVNFNRFDELEIEYYLAIVQFNRCPEIFNR